MASQKSQRVTGRAGQESKPVTSETRDLLITLLGSRSLDLCQLSCGKKMPNIKRSQKAPLDGQELTEPTLHELGQKRRETKIELYEGKRKVKYLWPIFTIHHQKTHCIFDLFINRKPQRTLLILKKGKIPDHKKGKWGCKNTYYLLYIQIGGYQSAMFLKASWKGATSSPRTHTAATGTALAEALGPRAPSLAGLWSSQILCTPFPRNSYSHRAKYRPGRERGLSRSRLWCSSAVICKSLKLKKKKKKISHGGGYSAMVEVTWSLKDMTR